LSKTSLTLANDYKTLQEQDIQPFNATIVNTFQADHYFNSDLNAASFSQGN